jgi:hypothetical protein
VYTLHLLIAVIDSSLHLLGVDVGSNRRRRLILSLATAGAMPPLRIQSLGAGDDAFN